MKIKGLIISAIKSGSGKTIASLSVMKLLKDCGYDVIPFKVGPDFIDPSHYRYICGVDGRNLDTFFMEKDFIAWNIGDAIKESNAKNPIVVIEGVMGLFDGYGEEGRGSTAELAKLLGFPVVLVIDAKGMSQSLAPLIYGFKNWDREVSIGGVILNRIGSENHYNFLKEMINRLQVEPLGYIKRDDGLSLGERHLGIVMGHERKEGLDQSLLEASKGLDINALEKIMSKPIEINPKEILLTKTDKRIYIARDEAFSFCYKENIRILEMLGDVSFFSPLRDGSLKDPYFVYLPGGYPELYLEELSKNKKMMDYLRDYVDGGGYLLGECGGFIYLSKGLKVDKEEKELCGIFPFYIEMAKSYSSLGYVEVETKDNPLFGSKKFKGHRFHYSFISKEEGDMKRSYRLKRHNQVMEEGYTYKNAVGSYVHLHFGSNIEAIQDLFIRS